MYEFVPPPKKIIQAKMAQLRYLKMLRNSFDFVCRLAFACLIFPEYLNKFLCVLGQLVHMPTYRRTRGSFCSKYFLAGVVWF